MPTLWQAEPGYAPNALDNDKYYQVVLNGVYQLQSIKNILWYRIGFDLLPGGMNVAGAEHLAFLVYEHIWLSNLRDVMASTYKLQDITVIPYNGQFDPIYNLPFIREVNEFGTQAWASAGPAACFTARFILEPQVLGLAGWFPPRRGYLALGPIRESDVDEAGRITSSAETYWEANIQVLSQDLAGLPWPVTFFPIRVRITKLLGGTLRLDGYTDISGIDLRPVATFRRSRLPEA